MQMRKISDNHIGESGAFSEPVPCCKLSTTRPVGTHKSAIYMLLFAACCLLHFLCLCYVLLASYSLNAYMR